MCENRTLKHKTTIHAGLILTILFFSLCATAVATNVPDVNQPGLYEVGHIWYEFKDYSRVPTYLEYWPVTVNVFYPVNPEDINSSTSKTIYHFEDFYQGWQNDGPWYEFESSDYEGPFDLEPAYLNPPVSDNGPFPLVMVSHGGGTGGTGLEMFSIGTRLASHGFTIAIINHYSDHIPPDPLVLVDWTANISFALSTLLEINETEGAILYGAINPNKIAAAGFSWGGTSSLALAGGKEACVEDNCETIVDIDPRIKAVVSLDGGSFVFNLNELNRISIPVLSIGEDWENLAAYFFGWAGFRARLHAATIQAHPSYRIDIHGLSHKDFPYSTQEIKRIITKYMIAFLKTNLSGESGYKKILTPGHALTHESMVSFFVTEKCSLKAGFVGEWVGIFDYPPNLFFIKQPGYDEANAYKEDE